MLATLILADCAAPPAQPVAYLPHGGKSETGGVCLLCVRGPQENDSLAFLSINDTSICFVELARYAEDGTEKRFAYSSISYFGDITSGCGLQSRTYPESGKFIGTIRPGASPAPDQANMERMFCQSCRESVNQAVTGFDMLLVDVQAHNLYDICGNYRFEIRDFRIRSKRKRDGSIKSRF